MAMQMPYPAMRITEYSGRQRKHNSAPVGAAMMEVKSSCKGQGSSGASFTDNSGLQYVSAENFQQAQENDRELAWLLGWLCAPQARMIIYGCSRTSHKGLLSQWD